MKLVPIILALLSVACKARDPNPSQTLAEARFWSTFPWLVNVRSKYTDQKSGEIRTINGKGFILDLHGRPEQVVVTASHVSQGAQTEILQFDSQRQAFSQLRFDRRLAWNLRDTEVFLMSPSERLPSIGVIDTNSAEVVLNEAVVSGWESRDALDQDLFRLGLSTVMPRVAGMEDYENVIDLPMHQITETSHSVHKLEYGQISLTADFRVPAGASGMPIMSLNYCGPTPKKFLFGLVSGVSREFAESYIIPAEVAKFVTKELLAGSNDKHLDGFRWNLRHGSLIREGEFPKKWWRPSEAGKIWISEAIPSLDLVESRVHTGDGTRSDTGDGTRSDTGDGTRSDTGDGTRSDTGDGTRSDTGDGTRSDTGHLSKGEFLPGMAFDDGNGARVAFGFLVKLSMPTYEGGPLWQHEVVVTPNLELIGFLDHLEKYQSTLTTTVTPISKGDFLDIAFDKHIKRWTRAKHDGTYRAQLALFQNEFLGDTMYLTFEQQADRSLQVRFKHEDRSFGLSIPADLELGSRNVPFPYHLIKGEEREILVNVLDLLSVNLETSIIDTRFLNGFDAFAMKFKLSESDEQQGHGSPARGPQTFYGESLKELQLYPHFLMIYTTSQFYCYDGPDYWGNPPKKVKPDYRRRTP